MTGCGGLVRHFRVFFWLSFCIALIAGGRFAQDGSGVTGRGYSFEVCFWEGPAVGVDGYPIYHSLFCGVYSSGQFTVLVSGSTDGFFPDLKFVLADGFRLF